MPTNVLMPQMGESIAEGTIVRWIKQVGDTVDRDEPLFEISTDKVDAEIPSPAGGVLAEIRAQRWGDGAGQLGRGGRSAPRARLWPRRRMKPTPSKEGTEPSTRGSLRTAAQWWSPARRHPADCRRWCGNSPPSTTSI